MKNPFKKPIIAIVAILILLGSAAFPPAPARAATLTVTKTADTNDGVCDSDCSLREAIATASASDTITFDSSLSGGVIYLQSTLSISTNLTIDGSALASQVTLSGDSDNNGTGNVRVFFVNANVTLNSLIVTKGSSTFAGGIYHSFAKTLNILNSTVSNNAATAGGGGGIKNDGTLNITDSTFSGNSSTSTGGGIYNEAGTVTVYGSTFSANSATNGGGIYNANSTLTVTNSTFSANTATTNGGGIYNIGGGHILTVRNSTFSANSATTGGGIYYGGSTTFNYSNTLIANSSSGGDCAGAGSIGTNTNNLVEDASCSASLSGDPNLDALADNGGSTRTFALLTGSTAIDAGDNIVCAASPVNNLDQRGVTRPQGTQCDIGSYEIQKIYYIYLAVISK